MDEISKSQQLMVEDGAPMCLFKTKEERAAGWARLQPVVVKAPIPVAIELTPAEQHEKEIATIAERRWRDFMPRIVNGRTRIKRPRIEAFVKEVRKELKVAARAAKKQETVARAAAKTQEKKMPKTQDFNSMTGPELVAAFNAMSPVKVKRFSDRKTALRRCEEAAKSAAPAPAAKKSEATGIVAEFGQRTGGNREALLVELHNNIGEQVVLPDLAKIVYDDANNTGPVLMVLKGLNDAIAARKLSYHIKRKKVDGVVSYGLYEGAQ